jgi:hypothetical protein
MYPIHRETYQGQLVTATRHRGPRARYPLRDMRPSEWILVPVEEETLLWRSARNARHKHGVQIRVSLTADGAHWHVERL